MDLSVNNISFNGRKEVLYGIRSAAKSARQAEISRSYAFGPHPEHREGMVSRFVGKLHAYLDMAAHDDAFISTIKEVSDNKTFMTDFAQNLITRKVNYGEISPINTFNSAMKEVIINIKDSSIQSACHDFMGKLNETVAKL